MAKALPSGTVDTPWKRLPSGVFVPGNMGLPSGTDIRAVQDLIRNIFVAAGQKTMVVVAGAEAIEVSGGAAVQEFNWCTNRLPYAQATAGSRPTYNASDAGFGGKPSISGNGARWLPNATDPPAPSAGTPWYQKSVCRLDSWPPGGRCWYGSTANRFGVYTRGTPDSIQLSNNNVAPSGPVDQPLGRAGVLTYRMGNSTSDFLRFGATANTATGINVGNTNPASLGKLAIATGTQGIVGSEAIQFAWQADLTAGEDQAVDDLLNAYFGGGLLIYSSTGNIRSAGAGWLGSSQTYFTQGAAVNYQGARWRWFTNFVTTLGYPMWTSGLNSSGNWPQPAHTGISALGINIDTNGPNPGAGLAAASAYFNPAGAAPAAGAGEYRWINIELGGADCAGGVYVAGTTVNDLKTICTSLKTWNPKATLSVNTIPCQAGNPASVAALSAEIRDPGGLWDQLDALPAFASYPVARPDPNFVVAVTPGVYNAPYYVDNVHYNQTGQLLWGDEINTKSAAAMNLRTQYGQP